MVNLVAPLGEPGNGLYLLTLVIFAGTTIFACRGILFGHLAGKLEGWRYMFAGPQIIDKAYAQNPSRPFQIRTPSNSHLMITTSELIKEVLDAPPSRLSLHAVAKELLQPKYTMYGFEWQEQRGVEGTGFVRALRSRLTSHLPQFQPELDRIIRGCLLEELDRTPDENGFVPVELFPMIKRVITRVNCFVFFGKELSENSEFTEAALAFPQTVVLAAEILRITPAFMCPLVAWIVTKRHRAAKTLFRYLEPEVCRRRAEMAQADRLGVSKPAARADCMQWLIDTSPKKDPWSTPRMIGETLAIWFSSVHQLAMVSLERHAPSPATEGCEVANKRNTDFWHMKTTTFVIQDICQHQEYVDPLRQEIGQVTQEGKGLERIEERLPLLDSFVKESIRLSNADALSCRRKALDGFTLQDGSIIHKNDWVCIPQRAMMCDERRYANPHAFDGYRFARANDALRQGNATADVPDKTASTVTSASLEWPIWGLGNATCPGRFYASLILKLITANLLQEWECKLRDTTAPRSMVWRSSIVPRSDTVVLLRKREVREMDAAALG
ncbi:cytochrome P450 [Apiospora saccharicola]|uniref:Cytochrome P450 n=1 Tax=Apiospora saccharicola TaxID=335842 RepID=A0ABR1UN26_9PEZI